MLNPHLIDLNQRVFKRDQPDIARIAVIVVTGTLDRAIVHKVGRLPAKPPQCGLEVCDTGLKSREYRCGGDPLCFMEMGDMQIRIRQFIENHRKVAIDW
jgi:hypothetical protein